MKLQILPGCTPDMWYSELVGEELPCLGEDADIYWSREPGHPGAKNVVLKADAVLIDEVREAYEEGKEMYSETLRMLAEGWRD